MRISDWSSDVCSSDEHSCVRGVVLDGETVSANSVIIATGGFGHNRLLLNRHYPEAAQHGDWTWAITAKTCTGDGLLMGQEVGADIRSEEHTSELQSLMRISYAVFCFKKNRK